MLDRLTIMVCPECRVFTDACSDVLPEHADVPCPWCGAVSEAHAYAEAATREQCDACKHPVCAHVAWTTPDGSPPHPLTRAHSHPTAAPCVFCAREGKPECVQRDGSREVVS